MRRRSPAADSQPRAQWRGRSTPRKIHEIAGALVMARASRQMSLRHIALAAKVLCLIVGG
jgi:hypothetical protein